MSATRPDLLRPRPRTTRRLAALVVVALFGWLVAAAGHLHLDGHDHGSAGGHPPHPCSVCLSLERGAGPAAAPTVVLAAPVALAAVATDVAPLPSPPPPRHYQSRAPPSA